jgi:hypothetical protein
LAFGSPGTAHLVHTLQLFEACDPASARTAQVAVTARAGHLLDAASAEVVRRLGSRNLGRFAVTGFASTPRADRRLGSLVVDDWWWEAGEHQQHGVFEVLLPEWTLEAIGWVVALLAGELSALGLGTVRLTVRGGGPDHTVNSRSPAFTGPGVG